jgi:hypothetical protein
MFPHSLKLLHSLLAQTSHILSARSPCKINMCQLNERIFVSEFFNKDNRPMLLSIFMTNITAWNHLSNQEMKFCEEGRQKNNIALNSTTSNPIESITCYLPNIITCHSIYVECYDPLFWVECVYFTNIEIDYHNEVEFP